MLQKRIFYLLFICFILPLLAFTQNDFGLKETYSASVTSKDTSIKAEVLYGPKLISTKQDVMYYWFSKNKIISTQGAYKGRLLHGEYYVFYNATNNIKQKGAFDNGAKTGEWVSWYSNGLIKESTYWKGGRLNGPFKKYDNKGKLIEAGRYSNNLLNGTLYEYKEGKVLQTRKYKKGIEVTDASIAPIAEPNKPDKALPPRKGTAATKLDTTAKKANAAKAPIGKKPNVLSPKK